MKHLFAYVAIALSLSVSPVLSLTAPGDGNCDADDLAASGAAAVAGLAQDPDCPPTVVLESEFVVGEATNLLFLAPVIGAGLALGVIAGGGDGDATPSTPTTN